MNTRCMNFLFSVVKFVFMNHESMYIFKNYIRMMITIMKVMCIMMILVIGIRSLSICSIILLIKRSLQFETRV